MDYIKIITGIILSIIGLVVIIYNFPKLSEGIFGLVIIIFGLIIIFNKFENKIEKRIE